MFAIGREICFGCRKFKHRKQWLCRRCEESIRHRNDLTHVRKTDMAMTNLERRLFERAVTTLVCALAHDEATQHNADAETLAELRGHWIDDAEEVTDKATRLGLWG